VQILVIEQFVFDAGLPDAAPALPPLPFPKTGETWRLGLSGLQRAAFKRIVMTGPQIDIYTKFGCPFCVRAKRLLDQKGAVYSEYDITLGGPKREEMRSRAPGATTVPQIFIGETHVGGSDDLAALDAAGKLDALLAG
jgi:glutaredoxin 3